MDFVGARRERYPQPGALPEVEPGTLIDDLKRRDFRVNAMALRLSGPDAGELVDPLGGRRDIDARVIATLRAGAFAEDPSRVVRAARYAARLGFGLAEPTEEEARRVAPELDWASARVAEELRRVFDEADPAPAVALLRRLGARGLAAPEAAGPVAALDAALAALGDDAPERWAVLLGRFSTESLLREVALPGWAVETARSAARAAHLASDLARAESPSAADRLLGAAGLAAVAAAAAAGAPWAERWMAEDRHRRLAIDGDALLEAGVRQGPRIGAGLAAAREAMLDGRAPTRERQLQEALAAAGP